MIKCSRCNKNYAIVFVTKIVEGKKTSEGLCLTCARNAGMANIEAMMGVSAEQVEELDEQLREMIDNGEVPADMDSLSDFIYEKFGERLEDVDINKLEAGNPDGSNVADMFKKGGFFESMITPGAIAEGQNPDAEDAYSDADENSEAGADSSERQNWNSAKDKLKTKKEDMKKNKRKFLSLYATNLTDAARTNSIDRVIGRQREIDRVIQILNRRSKNNPVLLGEPGVGKTAIAEGLAVRIIEGKVPAKLLNVEIYLLDLTAMVAGTQFRGQFESRMKGVLDEAKAEKNIILVIDELHSIVGAGDAEGSMNAANILKPALARGDIQIMGATTLDEYRKHIEKDSALERRFQPVIVDEPSAEDAIEILKGIRGYYEDFHHVTLSDEIIESAVNLSQRYITDRFLPDKAIDVIDEAGSRANLKNEGLVELESLKKELDQVQSEKEEAISADSIEDYQKAADLKIHECRLLEKIADIEKKALHVEITFDDIAYVIEAWTKIPVHRISELEMEKLMHLEDRLHHRLIGQNKAVEAVAKAIRRNRSGFKKKKKSSSFIFVGPTGVGKTELVRTLAKELFDDENAMIRLDMSEYSEKHTVSKIIGAPPGYVGYDEAGQLTEKVRRRPYSVILLDEIEKAHPDLFHLLLQIMEDGRLTDSHGKVVNFENTILIMTSNAGTNLNASGIGFGSTGYAALEVKVKSALNEFFKPEFLNRVDEVVIFNELNNEELVQIAGLMLNEVSESVVARKMTISYEDGVKEFIAKRGFDPKMGARPMRRVVQTLIEDKLADLYIKQEIKEGDHINAALAEDGEDILLTKVDSPLIRKKHKAAATAAPNTPAEAFATSAPNTPVATTAEASATDEASATAESKVSEPHCD